MKSRRTLGVLGLTASLLALPAPPADAAPRPGRTEWISRAVDGSAQDSFSYEAALDATGRFVAFTSLSSNLVEGDTNEATDIFVHDRSTGSTERVSVSSDGGQAEGYSYEPDISSDGRFVVFNSSAPGLVPQDTNEWVDVFVHDRHTRSTILVSAATDGTPAGFGSSDGPSISGDGRFVAFASEASNLVPDDTNNEADIFVRDLANGTTEIVSLSADGSQSNDRSFDASISADGSRVAFVSTASNLVADDTNGLTNVDDGGDVFVVDRTLGTIVRASIGSDGRQANGRSSSPDLSGDGSAVVFETEASNLVPNDTNWQPDVFVHDLDAGTTERVSLNSVGDAGSYFYNDGISISDDGRFVAFATAAPAMLPEDPPASDHALVEAYFGSGLFDQVYVHDRLTAATERVSVSNDGSTGDYPSNDAAISGDGLVVAFSSVATNLGDGDSPDSDVFVRERGPRFGLADLEVSADGTTLSGTYRAPKGAETSVLAPSDPVDPIAREAGTELLGARIVHRPEEDDLLFVLDVPKLPGFRPVWGGSTRPTVRGVPLNPWATFPSPICPTCFHPSVSGLPGVAYGWSFVVEDVRYELRADRFGDDRRARFRLLRCEASCTETAALRGGFGTAGNSIGISLPTSLVSSKPDETLSNVTAFVSAADQTYLRRLAVPELRLEPLLVAVGAGPDGEEPTFGDDIVVSGGRFELALGPQAASAQAVHVRLCRGRQCSVSVVRR